MAMEHRSLGGAKVVRRKMKGGLLVEAQPQELILRPQGLNQRPQELNQRPQEPALIPPAPNVQYEPIQNAVPAKPDDSKRCKYIGCTTGCSDFNNPISRQMP